MGNWIGFWGNFMPSDCGVAKPAEIDGIILSSTAQVLEEMFFTGIEATGNEGEVAATNPIHVELRFSGPLAGAFRLLMDEEAARVLGCTLTCPEGDEFPRERSVQVAGELANMICGSLLSHLEPDANLSLTSPAEVGDDSVMEGSIRRWFCVPEGALSVEFALDGKWREALG